MTRRPRLALIQLRRSSLLSLLGAVALAGALGLAAAEAAPAERYGKIAFVSARQSDSASCCQTDIFTMRGDGSRARPVMRHPAHDSQPSLAPSGARLVFTSDRHDSAGDIYAIGTDGSRLRRLTATAGSDFDPAWAPLPR